MHRTFRNFVQSDNNSTDSNDGTRTFGTDEQEDERSSLDSGW